MEFRFSAEPGSDGKVGSGFYTSVKVNDKVHKVIATNNHVISNKKEAENTEVWFHYEGNEADIRKTKLHPNIYFETLKVRKH